MKTVSSIVISFFLALTWTGCGDSTPSADPATTPSSPADSPTAISPKITPFRQTSFAEVTAQLDPEGSIYGYLAMDQWLADLSEKVALFKETLTALPMIEVTDHRRINLAFDLAQRLVDSSGIEDCSGAGISGVQISPELYRTKFILHHGKDRGAGFFWSTFGKTEHEIRWVDFLPDTTAVAGFGDFDGPGLWQVLARELAQSGIPEWQQAVESWPETFHQWTDLSWPDVLNSLGGDLGAVLTLDAQRTLKVPLGGEGAWMDVPEPGLMVAIKVSNDLVYDRISRELLKNPSVTTTNEPGLKLTIMPVPLPLPVPLNVALASSGDYLFIATSPDLVRTALAIRNGAQDGLKDSKDFKELTRYVNLTGNQFSYVDRRFAQAVLRIQQQMLEGAGMASNQVSMVQNLFYHDSAAYGVSVGGHTPIGWQTVSVGNQDSATAVVVVPAVALGAFSAGLIMPALAKARAKAQSVQQINKVKQLALGILLYAEAHQGKLPPADTWCDAIFDYTGGNPSVFHVEAQTNKEFCSFAFNASLSEKSMRDLKSSQQTVLVFEASGAWNLHGGKELLPSFPRSGRGFVVGFMDGSVRTVPPEEVDKLLW